MSLFRVLPQRATVCSLPPGGNKNAYMKHVDACKEVLLGSGNTPVRLEGRPLAEASGSRNIPGRHAFLPASAALSSDAALTDVQKTKPSPQSLECLTSPSSGRSAPPSAPSAVRRLCGAGGRKPPEAGQPARECAHTRTQVFFFF